MISSVFNNSKPINFAIAFFMTLLAFLVLNIKYADIVPNFGFIANQIFLLFVIYLSVFLISFIVEKNSLTQNTNYEIICYCLFLLAFPQILSDSNIIYANFFVLLGCRRVASLHTQAHVSKKLFDAAFWFSIASLFYFWSLLFFLLIIFMLILYVNNNIKHWFIPFIGVLAVFVLTVTVSLVRYDSFFELFGAFPEVSYNFSSYNTTSAIIFITLLFSFGLWASIFYLKNTRHKKKSVKPVFYAVLFAVLIGFLIIVVAPHKNGSEFLFILAPLAVVIASYIEIIQEKWFKELFISVLLVLSFILLML